MDLTTLMSALLSDNSLQSTAAKTDVDVSDVAGVLAAALPTMLNGANQQAQSEETAESFHEAVTEHAAKKPEEVDIEEGGKIVNHLLGDDADKIEKAIAKKTGLSKAKVALVLAAAAPLIMNMLGKQTTSNNSTSAATTASLLGSLLGGGSNSAASNALMTAALGAVLSNAMGGSSSNASSSVLGSLLGANQQSNQINSSAALLGSLLGATQQPQQQTSSSVDLLGGLLSLLK